MIFAANEFIRVHSPPSFYFGRRCVAALRRDEPARLGPGFLGHHFAVLPDVDGRAVGAGGFARGLRCEPGFRVLGLICDHISNAHRAIDAAISRALEMRGEQFAGLDRHDAGVPARTAGRRRNIAEVLSRRLEIRR